MLNSTKQNPVAPIKCCRNLSSLSSSISGNSLNCAWDPQWRSFYGGSSAGLEAAGSVPEATTYSLFGTYLYLECIFCRYVVLSFLHSCALSFVFLSVLVCCFVSSACLSVNIAVYLPSTYHLPSLS